MAGKIAVIDDEYTDVKSKLTEAHNQILEALETVVEQLQGLSSSGGDFYTDSISPKVALLCEEIQTARSSMADVYSAHQEIVSSFKTAIGDLDTCC